MSEERPKFLLLNGNLVEYDQARVHVLSVAMKYGAIVFEGLRAYWNERQQELYGFRLDDHFRRLNESMLITRIAGPRDIDDYREAMLGLIRANDLRQDLHMRVQVFVDAIDGGVASTAPVSVSMAAIPLGRMFARDGLHCAVSSWARIDDRSMPPRVKTAANYHNSRLALTQARIDGYEDTIILTHDGKVSEGPGYGIMMVRHGQLCTPPVTDGILESITRDTLIRLAREKLGLAVRERPIDRTELYVAEELFFCGSGAEVAPILSVDRHPIGNGEVGALTRTIRDLYFSFARGERPDEYGWLTPTYGG